MFKENGKIYWIEKIVLSRQFNQDLETRWVKRGETPGKPRKLNSVNYILWIVKNVIFLSYHQSTRLEITDDQRTLSDAKLIMPNIKLSKIRSYLPQRKMFFRKSS